MSPSPATFPAITATARPHCTPTRQVNIGAPALDPMETSMEPQIQERLLVATTATHKQVSTNASTP
jgi:hypothetical protein